MVVQISVDFFLRGSYWYTRVNHVDNAGNLQSAPIIIDFNPFANSSQQYYFFNSRQVIGSATFYMPAGTRLYIDVNALTDTTLFAGGQMEIYQLGSYGGVYQVVNENSSFVSRTSFDIPTDFDTWQGIKDEPFKFVNATYISGSLNGYPIDIERNIQNGNTSFNLYQRKLDVN